MQFTPEQDAAVAAVVTWHRSGGTLFKLFGAAGTGKTSIAKRIATEIGGNVLFATFTGKASSVLRKKGCPATTIHKLIYKPFQRDKSSLKDIGDEIDSRLHLLQGQGKAPEEISKDEELIHLRQELDKQHDRLGGSGPMFSLNDASVLRDADLLIVDEVSMIDQVIGHDLESFDTPILVLGDPYQLPPIKGTGYFNNNPDVLLTEIHRQALDNPILRLATMARMGLAIPYGVYGNSKVIRKSEVDPKDVLSADQILVGKNATRRAVNHRSRELCGRTNPMPVEGDRIVCRRNNHEMGLLNGEQWIVESSTEIPCGKHGNRRELELQIKTLPGEEERSLICTAHSEYFIGDDPPVWEIRERESFEYGYGITVHTSQGSEWPYIYLFDESRCFRQNSAEHLYTAITRAMDRITIVI